MAWTRKSGQIPSFTPEQQEQADQIKQKVLDQTPAPAQSDVAPPAAKPMIPSFYAEGGPVKKIVEPVITYQNTSDPSNISKAAKWYSDPDNNAEYRRSMQPGDYKHAEGGSVQKAYRRGGSVKAGSDTSVSCNYKHR